MPFMDFLVLHTLKMIVTDINHLNEKHFDKR